MLFRSLLDKSRKIQFFFAAIANFSCHKFFLKIFSQKFFLKILYYITHPLSPLPPPEHPPLPFSILEPCFRFIVLEPCFDFRGSVSTVRTSLVVGLWYVIIFDLDWSGVLNYVKQTYTTIWFSYKICCRSIQESSS